ncbi:MAG: hypothetical protein QOK10_1414, partial [Pseudonocardiales bacterium]|nr:hypothetical protein [Pseudonocardiales bacterium]
MSLRGRCERIQLNRHSSLVDLSPMNDSRPGSSDVNVAAQQRHCHAVALPGDHLPNGAGVLPALKFCDPIDVHAPTIP